jgi:oligosaccharide repeat unit polymerase
MVLFLTVFCSVVALISWAKLKNPFNPFTFMFALWSLWIPLSDTGFHNMKHPSPKTYSVILCGLTAYLIGALIGYFCVGIRIKKTSDSNSVQKLYVNYWLVHFLCCISILFYLYQCSKVIPLLLSGHDLGYIRDLLFSYEENEMRSSGLIVILNNFMVTPTTYFMMAYLPVEVFREKDRNNYLIAEIIIMLVLWIFTTGGRTVLLFMGVSLLCVYLQKLKDKKLSIYLLLRNKIKKTSKLKKFLILGGCTSILVVAMFMITFSRSGEKVDILRTLYIYFGAPIEFLDYNINLIDNEHSNIYGYGVSSFYGFIYPIMFLLRILYIVNPYPAHMTLIHDMSVGNLQNVVNLGGDININAFATLFYQPYLDGRFVGVAIILALLGFVGSLFYFKWTKQKSILYQTAYLLILHKILFSMVRFWFTQPGQAISLILAFIVISPYALKIKVKR